MARRGIHPQHYFLKDINPVVRFLIISDAVILGAGGLLGPIFALFVEDFIIGGSAAVAGIAAGVYLFSRSILQIPFAHFLDAVRGEQDDFWFLFVCSVLFSLVPLLYLIISTPMQLYVVQAILGLFTAFTYPSFTAIFTRHVDSGKEGTEWSIYFTLTDMLSAALAMVGGFIASTGGFTNLIILVVIVSVLGSLLLLPIRPYMQDIF